MFLFNNEIGRLGNQLFMYAAARSLSQKKGAAYAFTRLDKLRYFRLTFEDRYLNELKKRYFLYALKRYNKTRSLDLTDCWSDHRDTVLSTKGHCFITGYFQGEWYFKDHEDEIRRLLTVRPKHRHRFERIYQDQMAGTPTVVAVHMRRGDYLHWNIKGLGGPGFNLPLDYYQRLIDRHYSPEVKFVFVSDDITFAEQHFSDLPNAWFSHADEITDLQILMHADVCILSNSSFSWWGGWLNQRPGKQVYMPEYYCGFKVEREFPVNIIPKHFHQVNVNSGVH